MKKLLWIEEAQEKKNIRRYDLRDAQILILETSNPLYHDSKLTFCGETYHILEVPGLAEKRPSVLANDSIFAWIPGTTDVEYEGIVKKVLKDHVILVFCQDFNHRTNGCLNFNVRFLAPRIMSRYMHRAVDMVDLNLIWPKDVPVVDAKKLRGVESIEWFDREILKNEEQMKAIHSVINGLHGRVPYLLFGAFGCGKSRALVELILQLKKNWK